MSAFWYIIWTSGKNRFLTLARRARSPRYAIALIVGGLYVWAFLLRPMNSGMIAPALLGQSTQTVVVLLAVITLMGSWVFGSDATALAFTQAEVSILFSAPLTRRSLIGYKLFRAQIAVLINALIWVFVLRRGGTELPPALRAISLWLMFSTLNLHRLGAALVRSSWREHGAAGKRRNIWSILVFAAVGLAVVVTLVESRRELADASGFGSFFAALARVMSTPPASWALWPFRIVVAPTFAHTAAEWQRLVLPAVGVVALHALWVLRTDTAFEDAAIEASAERAKRLETMRSRRSGIAMGAPKAATSTIPLAATGHPALAILWKNMLCLRRTTQLRLFIGPTVMALALGAAMSSEDGDGASVIATSALALAAMLLIFGGRLIRNDLRQDMRHLPLLKTLPIAPGELMMAEVASATLPMAAAQVALMFIAYVAALFSQTVPVSPSIRTGLVLSAPFAAVALTAALLTIQNGMAVLFPSWVRLGPAMNTGVEALGQNVLATMANLVSLAVALALPALVAFLAVSLLGQPPAVALALVIIVSAAILTAETYLVLRLLGRALAKAEPLQTA